MLTTSLYIDKLIDSISLPMAFESCILNKDLADIDY